MLRLEQVTVAYDGFTAVQPLDLEVADGEIVCVLGPSGSGKSSLLRAVAGLEPDASGRVSWDGTDLTRVPPHRRGFGLMFQDHALFPHRDVEGNVAFGLRMQRLPRAEIETRTGAALALVGLTGFEHRRITELSGGEQQRVAIARALANRPGLLLADEPTGELDSATGDQIAALLDRVNADGTALVIVTHDPGLAARATRILTMADGRVVSEVTR